MPSQGLLQNRTLEIFLACVAAILLFSALFPKQAKPRDLNADAPDDCKGMPIQVALAYTGGPLDPWSCKPQCDDKQQHYLLYTNGVATQCGELPGCYDSGEDDGVTCKIPTNSNIAPVGSASSAQTSE